jgi:hypothetical protein
MSWLFDEGSISPGFTPIGSGGNGTGGGPGCYYALANPCGAAPSKPPQPVMPRVGCGVEGCQAVSGNPVVIPKYARCVFQSTVAGGAGGFTGGVATSWFTEGVSIGALTIIGGVGGFGTVACF